MWHFDSSWFAKKRILGNHEIGNRKNEMTNYHNLDRGIIIFNEEKNMVLENKLGITNSIPQSLRGKKKKSARNEL